MDYLAYFFFNHLVSVSMERRIVDGKEEDCLIIPTRQNQIKKGRQGNWMMMCRLAECEPNARGQTHDIQLSYLYPDDLQKSYDFGYHKRTAHLGRVYEHDRTPEKKIDRTNNATDIKLDGTIVLSDIPKSRIFHNAENAKRYVRNLTLRSDPDNGVIYTGSICVDDIPLQDIQTDQNTGKKYVKVRFIKLLILDTYMNTHQLIISRDDGSEIEIGRFKEWVSENGRIVPDSTKSAIDEIHNTGVNQRQAPEEIGGIKF